jgi:hypothetical protein
MTTSLDHIRDSIAYLEKTHPDSRLLKDLWDQLAAFEDQSGQSAHALYCSGNPCVPAKQRRRK